MDFPIFLKKKKFHENEYKSYYYCVGFVAKATQLMNS